MAITVLASGKGAPGATTTALALTLQWPRPALLVEADLAGSSILPGFFRGQLPHDRGLAQLAVAQSHGAFEERFRGQTMPLVESDVDKRFLAGIPGPHATPSVVNLWAPLARHLAALERSGVDVIVDAGRVGAIRDDREVLLRLADQVLVTTGSRLPDVAATRDVVRAHLGVLDPAARELTNVAVLVVGAGRPYDVGEIARVVGCPVAGAIAWDPASAEVLSAGDRLTRRYESSPLVRSIGPVIDMIQKRIASRRARFATEDVA